MHYCPVIRVSSSLGISFKRAKCIFEERGIFSRMMRLQIGKLTPKTSGLEEPESARLRTSTARALSECLRVVF